MTRPAIVSDWSKLSGRVRQRRADATHAHWAGEFEGEPRPATKNEHGAPQIHDNPKLQRATNIAFELADKWREPLERIGVKTVMGGSLVSGIAIDGPKQDMDMRFLYDGDPADVQDKIEKITGLKFAKKGKAGGGEVPWIDTVHVQGELTDGDVTLEIDGQIRSPENYVGWAQHYPDVLTRGEMREIRAEKSRLWDEALVAEAAAKGDKDAESAAWKPYKDYKNSVMKTVKERVGKKRTDALIDNWIELKNRVVQRDKSQRTRGDKR